MKLEKRMTARGGRLLESMKGLEKVCEINPEVGSVTIKLRLGPGRLTLDSIKQERFDSIKLYHITQHSIESTPTQAYWNINSIVSRQK
jgi:hypothetical protein